MISFNYMIIILNSQLAAMSVPIAAPTAIPDLANIGACSSPMLAWTSKLIKLLSRALAPVARSSSRRDP